MGIKTSKIGGLKSRQKLYGNILVGLSFMALAFLTVKTFAPDVKSNADTNNASVESGPYISSISVDSLTSINITPTSTQSVYTGTNTISYTNTCPYGFNITLTSASDNTSLTRYGEDSATKEIPSTTTTSLSNNTWGVSKDNGSTYSPIPAISATPVNVINTFEATTNPATLNLIYGVKTDSSLPSGSYTNDLIYTVSAKPQCLAYGITWDFDGGTAKSGATYPETMNFGQTIDLSGLTPTKEGYEFTGWSNGTATFDGTETAANINPSSTPSLTMTAQWEQVQPMQGFSCSTLTNVGDTVKLRDARDGNIYTVKKLADGNCWMAGNLRIADKTISSADSNLPSGETYTVPASNLSDFTTAYNTSAAYVDLTYGGYYNFYTATAGWGTDTAESGSSPKDICPKGWRLPTNSEFEELYNHYNSKDLMMGDPAFVMAGVATDGIIKLRNEHGYYWSSINSDGDASNLDIKNNGVSPDDYSNLYRGYLVRCIADKTMQKYDVSQFTNTGDSVLLTDERDGNKYTVKKLADGKVWMTENLKIIGKTITSADSNVSSDFTIPASSVSGFNAQDTNNAYVDSTYGGYYTFYTATAGTGGTSLATDGANAPSSICPKGWRLPTGGSSGEFQTLYNNYNSRALMMDVPNFTLTGVVYDGSVSRQGSDGNFWSSTVFEAERAYLLSLHSSDVNPVDRPRKIFGFSVRCIAEDRTISDITYMQDMTSKIAENTPVDTAATLTDIRDNNTYTVRKLKDGKVWMTQNLRIIDKTITSADSNLPSGETWTIPASSRYGFDTYNTNDAYLDSTYGSYYGFYTATAGWGTNSVSSGSSPKDICPKGWRLPTGGSSGEFQTLYDNYSSLALMQGDPAFVLSGYVDNRTAYNQGTRGYYWSSSSSISDAKYAYNLFLDSSSVNPSYNVNKIRGHSIRCVAK